MRAPHSDAPGTEAKPLSGRRVLVTRAAAQAGPLADALRAAGAVPISCPTIKIEPAADYAALDASLRAVADYAWLVVTSANTVAVLEQRLQALGLGWDALSGAHIRVAAVGARTADDLRRYGVTVAYVPTAHSGAALAAGLPLRLGERVLVAQGDLAGERLAAGLRERGARVDWHIAYRTVPADPADVARARDMLAAGQIAAAAFASPSAIRNLYAALGGEAGSLLAPVVIACIGPTTAAAAKELGLEARVVATEQSVAGLVHALEEYYRDHHE